MLATETSPATTAAISADHASIAADQASLAELKAGIATTSTQASIAAAGAQLAKDEAQLASDKVKLAETQIIAPSAGTVIAINGQTGETVTAAGIRNYSSQPQSSGSQSPPFSLLPEGPAANVKSSSTQSALPMIALRTSSTWQVTVLVPESGIQQVHAGEAVTVAVPAVGLNGIRGAIQQVSPTPVSTSIGTAYQAIVRISGHQRVTPLGGYDRQRAAGFLTSRGGAGRWPGDGRDLRPGRLLRAFQRGQPSHVRAGLVCPRNAVARGHRAGEHGAGGALDLDAHPGRPRPGAVRSVGGGPAGSRPGL